MPHERRQIDHPAAGRFQLSRARHGDDAVDRGARRPRGPGHDRIRIALSAPAADLFATTPTCSTRLSRNCRSASSPASWSTRRNSSPRPGPAIAPDGRRARHSGALLRAEDRFPRRAVPRFGGAARLADTLIELKAVCDCGRKATMNLRVDAEGEASPTARRPRSAATTATSPCAAAISSSGCAKAKRAS